MTEETIELGFWRLAQADPERMALITPDGRENTAGELLAAANQVAHGLRALGLERGDTVAVVLPNGIELLEVYLGAMQIGLLPHPDQPPPRRARDRLHRQRQRRQGPRRPRAVRRRAGQGGRPRSTSPTTEPVRGRRRSTASGPAPSSTDGQPDTAPGRPHRRRAHALHVGHHRQAQGREAGARRHRPRRPGRALRRVPGDVRRDRRSTATCTSPARRSTTRPCCMWTANSLHMGHTVVLMDKWTPEGMLQLIDAARRHHQPHGAHPVPPPARPARGGAGEVRRVVAALHGARRRAVPARREAPDDRVVGRLDHGVLRGHRGRRHHRHRRGVDEEARHRRRGLARVGDPHPRRRAGERRAHRTSRAPST